MGVFFVGLGLMFALWAVFLAAVVVTEVHDRRIEPPPDVTPPPTHVRRLVS